MPVLRVHGGRPKIAFGEATSAISLSAVDSALAVHRGEQRLLSVEPSSFLAKFDWARVGRMMGLSAPTPTEAAFRALAGEELLVGDFANGFVQIIRSRKFDGSAYTADDYGVLQVGKELNDRVAARSAERKYADGDDHVGDYDMYSALVQHTFTYGDGGVQDDVWDTMVADGANGGYSTRQDLSAVLDPLYLIYDGVYMLTRDFAKWEAAATRPLFDWDEETASIALRASAPYYELFGVTLFELGMVDADGAPTAAAIAYSLSVSLITGLLKTPSMQSLEVYTVENGLVKSYPGSGGRADRLVGAA